MSQLSTSSTVLPSGSTWNRTPGKPGVIGSSQSVNHWFSTNSLTVNTSAPFGDDEDADSPVLDAFGNRDPFVPSQQQQLPWAPRQQPQQQSQQCASSSSAAAATEDEEETVVNSTEPWGQTGVDQSTPWEPELDPQQPESEQWSGSNNVWLSRPPIGTGVWEAHYESINASASAQPMQHQRQQSQQPQQQQQQQQSFWPPASAFRLRPPLQPMSSEPSDVFAPTSTNFVSPLQVLQQRETQTLQNIVHLHAKLQSVDQRIGQLRGPQSLPVLQELRKQTLEWSHQLDCQQTQLRQIRALLAKHQPQQPVAWLLVHSLPPHATVALVRRAVSMATELPHELHPNMAARWVLVGLKGGLDAAGRVCQQVVEQQLGLVKLVAPQEAWARMQEIQSLASRIKGLSMENSFEPAM